MLPDAGTYHFPWEINSALIPEGKTLRTFGRLHSYDVVSSQAILTAQQTSVQHIIQVCTKFVEPFQAQLGALYIVLGETEHKEGIILMLVTYGIKCGAEVFFHRLFSLVSDSASHFRQFHIVHQLHLPFFP
ncbi:CST complex subunit TEN1, partial [Podarcis lilfordi]